MQNFLALCKMYSQKTVGDEHNYSQYAIHNCESKAETESVLTSAFRDYCNYKGWSVSRDCD